MAEVIVREIQLFIARPGTKNAHIYYAVAYLNRVATMIAPRDEKVRLVLFKIYFSLFRKVVTAKEEKVQPKKVKKDRAKSKDQQAQEKHE